MNKKEIIENVAAGLRKMDIKPVAFIFNDFCQDWTWDNETILDYPIFHSCYKNLFELAISRDCPFLPVFDKEFATIPYQISLFNKGFDGD